MSKRPHLRPKFSSSGQSANSKEKNPAAYSIRFTREERARLDREAGPDGLAAHIRGKLFDGAETPRKTSARKPTVDREQLARVLGVLGQSRLSSNLNQLARAANTGSLPVSKEVADKLHQACKDVAAIRATLLKALGQRSGSVDQDHCE